MCESVYVIITHVKYTYKKNIIDRHRKLSARSYTRNIIQMYTLIHAYMCKYVYILKSKTKTKCLNANENTHENRNA